MVFFQEEAETAGLCTHRGKATEDTGCMPRRKPQETLLLLTPCSWTSGMQTVREYISVFKPL